MSADHAQPPSGSATNPSSGYPPQSGTQGYDTYAQQYAAAYAQQQQAQQQAQTQTQPSAFPVGTANTASTTQSAYGNNNATVPAVAGSGAGAASQPPNPYTGNPEGKRAHLYVGNLSPRVTEYMLQEIFSVAGPVQGVKIIPDRNFQHGGLNYGFIEYYEMRSAETALQTLGGRKIFDTEIRVNWAYQNSQSNVKEDLSTHYHVFVGDLSPEVNDEVLAKAFAAFGSLSDARVMWDMNSGKSRGYGFLAFRDKTDAEQAIATMNGEWLGSRAIRVNWANQKNQAMAAASGSMITPGLGGGMNRGGFGGATSYEAVVQQAPAYNTTVYTGNLVPYCTQADLIPLFQGFGYIVEIRMQADRGFAFVKMDTHENAAMSIVNLTGTPVHGRPLKCSWGKDRASADPNAAPTSGMPMAPVAGMYGMPQMYGIPQAGYQQYPGYPQYGAAPQAYGQPGYPVAQQATATTESTPAQQ